MPLGKRTLQKLRERFGIVNFTDKKAQQAGFQSKERWQQNLLVQYNDEKKRFAREKNKGRQRQRRQIKKDFEDFLKSQDFQEQPPQSKIRPSKQRTSRKQQNGNTIITYNFDLDMEVNNDIDDTLDDLEAQIQKALALRSIASLLRDDNTYLKLTLELQAYNTDGGATKGIETPFLPNSSSAITDLRTKTLQFESNYASDLKNINGFTVSFVVSNPTAGAGGKTIPQAHKVFKEISVSTYNNCLYVAIVLAKNAKIHKELLADEKSLRNRSYEMKKWLKQKGYTPKKMFSDKEEVKMCAEALKTPITIYNNLYMKIFEYNPQNQVKDKRTKARSPIELRVSNGHYTALLRRKDINEPYEEVVNDGEISALDDDILITKKKFFQDQNFKYGAYDIEATADPSDHNYHKAYGVGVAYNLNGEVKYERFWGMDCQEQFITYLLNNIKCLNGFALYAHNGGKYDYPNLFREALLKDDRFYVKNVVELNGRIIGFYITDGKHKIHFRDSLCLFVGQSLKDITKSLNVKHQKLHEIINHKDININNWQTHIPTLETYLEYDCKGLLECILLFSNSVYQATNINIDTCYTSATLSKKHYYKSYYDAKNTPIYFLSKPKDKFIRQSYFGGRTEAFHIGKIDEKLYYYDFTSLYPSEGRQKLPYGKPTWVEFAGNEGFDDFFGFTEVYVRTKNFDIKPIHSVLKTVDNKSKRLLFSHMKDWTKMILFSEEIRLGMKHDAYEYKFDGCKGIQFQAKSFMKRYFEDCFSKKQEAHKQKNKVLKMTYKIIANSGYGFWGLNWMDRESVVVEDAKENSANIYLQQGRLLSMGETGNYCMMKVVNDLPMKDFNVSIASAITSYSRMKLWSAMNDIENKGYNIYYCDTDSVVCNCDLTKHKDLMDKYCWDGCGEELGTLKNECSEKVEEVKDLDYKKQLALDGGNNYFDEMYIFGCKWYALKKTCYNGEDIVITKLKGYKDRDKPLQYKTFEDLYDNTIDCISQDQEQFNIPKSSFVDETRRFGLKVISIPKKFTINYKKGLVDCDGKVSPFVF